MSRLGFGIGVFRLQVADDLRVVLIPQPFVRVDEHITVVGARHRFTFRDGRADVGGASAYMVDERTGALRPPRSADPVFPLGEDA